MPIEGDESHPTLSQVLLTKIPWSNDFSMQIPWHPNWHRGTWAGARIDLVLLSDIEDIEQWKYITAETFMDYWKFAIRDGSLDERCSCQLCGKYRQMCKEEKENKDKGGAEKQESSKYTQASASGDDGKENLAPETRNEIKCEPDSYQEISNIKGSKRSGAKNQLSALETLPYEIFDHISSQLPRASLAACALTSTAPYSLAVRRLYASVDTPLDHFTRTFAETLARRPFLSEFVRDLSINVKPHWEPVKVLHEILKRLPNLTYLHVLPSWITYGDLPYWEYPFKLRTIKWGLMKDRASQKFIASQSDTLQEVEYFKLENR
jgi:hypothetical protein